MLESDLYLLATIILIVLWAIIKLWSFRSSGDMTKARESFNTKLMNHIDLTARKEREKFQQMSDVDGKDYNVVGKLPDKERAADVLAQVHERNLKLIAYLQKHYPNDERTKRLVRLYKRDAIKEVNPNNIFGDTSYTVGKGKEYGLCVRQKIEGTPFVPMNELMFVDIHELTHIATKSLQHPPVFWKNNTWLLKIAESINIIQSKDYSVHPEPYCGIMLTDKLP